jgi:hypothetical protein
MDEQITNESADGRGYWVYDAFGRPISYYHRADPPGGPGDDAVMEHSYYYQTFSDQASGEGGPTPASPCPDCHGTGRVMLLIRSRPCEKCGGTGAGL